MEKYELIKKLEDRGYDTNAACYLLREIEHIGDIEFLKLLTSFIGNVGQMKQAIFAFKQKIPLEVISFIYRKEFISEQMAEGRRAMKNGLSFDNLQYLYRAEFDSKQMCQCGIAFYHGVSIEK